jgi:hypothetical protein
LYTNNTPPPPPTTTTTTTAAAANVTTTDGESNYNTIVKLYIRHGSYVGYENDIASVVTGGDGYGYGSGGWTRQHVKITSMGSATAAAANKVTIALLEPIYIRKKQTVAFYISTATTTTTTSREDDDNEEEEDEPISIQVTTTGKDGRSEVVEGEPYSWNKDLIVNAGVGISSSSSSSSSSLVNNSSPRRTNDACVWNGELLYHTVNDDDDDMPLTITPTN